MCVCHVCWITKHDTGTFQKEGKDFPGTGNLAQDAAGVNSLCSCIKMSRTFQRTVIWSQLGGYSIYVRKSGSHIEQCQTLTVMEKHQHITSCVHPSNISNFYLRPCLPELPHTLLIAGWFTAHRTSPLICPLVKLPTQQLPASLQHEHFWTCTNISTNLFPHGLMQKRVPGSNREISCISCISIPHFPLFSNVVYTRHMHYKIQLQLLRTGFHDKR